MYLHMTEAHEAAAAYLHRDIARGYADSAQCDHYNRRSFRTITCDAMESNVTVPGLTQGGSDKWDFLAKVVITKKKDGRILVRMAYWKDTVTFYYRGNK